MKRALFFMILSCLSFVAPIARAQADKVDDYIKSEMDKRQIPGLALAIIKDGKVIKQKGYGIADVEQNIPVTPDTVFDLASMTKPITAQAILLLAEDGKLTLDDPLSSYITDAPESWRGITLRNLLDHTAGFGETDVPTVDGQWLADYSTATMLQFAKSTPLDSAPGERFQYSDSPTAKR